MDQKTGTPTVPKPRGYVISGRVMVSGIGVLLGIVFFILFLHFFVRWYVVRRYCRRRQLRSRLMFTAEDCTAVPRGGLDKRVLNSLSVQVFSKDDAAEAECAVCLCGFDEGEKVRVLPRCGHRFHVDCIDMWFVSHCACPLCRSAVEAVTSPGAAEEMESDPAAAATELAVSDLEPINREVRIEIADPEPVNRAESESSSGGVMVKLPGYRRISSIRRLLFGDLRPVRVGNSHAERGESTDGTPPPPPPPPASSQ